MIVEKERPTWVNNLDLIGSVFGILVGIWTLYKLKELGK